MHRDIVDVPIGKVPLVNQWEGANATQLRRHIVKEYAHPPLKSMSISC
jgi:hypothetical protein